jgi:hypothetical protein
VVAVKTRTWDNGKTKAVVIEIMDIFYNMGVEEIPEKYPARKEKEAHIKTIIEVIKQARAEGYTRYKLLTREEAEARGQDLGLNGVYLVAFKK